jgi:hypothetical protein
MGSRTTNRNRRFKALDNLRENAAVEQLSGDHLAVEPLRLESDRGSTCNEQPYQHHFGLTFLGIEYWGFNFVGTLTTAERSLERRPSLSVRVARDGQPSEEAPANSGVGGPTGGLRVRVGKT